MRKIIIRIFRLLPKSIKKLVSFFIYNILLNDFVLKLLLPQKSQKYLAYQKQRPFGPRKTICYAPHSSMFFGINGIVTACCFNRHVVYGNINMQSISDCWESNNIIRLREKLNDCDLSLGCFHCRNALITQSYQNVAAQQYDSFDRKKQYPSFLIFELSNKCNLNCIMCNIVSKDCSHTKHLLKESENPYDTSFFEELTNYIPYLKRTKFLGGEPFFIKEYYKIWELIINLNPNCIIEIQTNGTILNEKIRKILSKGRFEIYVSVDSFKKQTYEEIRRNASFETMMQNLDFFIDYSRKRNYIFSISVCPIKQNMWEIPSMVDYCNFINVHIYFNIVWTPDTCSLRFLSSDQIENLVTFYNQHNLVKDNSVSEHNYYQFLSLKNLLISWTNEVRQKEIFLNNLRNQGVDIHNLQTIDYQKLLFDYIKPNIRYDMCERYYTRIIELTTMINRIELLKEIFFLLISIPREQVVSEFDNKDNETLIKNAMSLIQKDQIF